MAELNATACGAPEKRIYKFANLLSQSETWSESFWNLVLQPFKLKLSQRTSQYAFQYAFAKKGHQQIGFIDL